MNKLSMRIYGTMLGGGLLLFSAGARAQEQASKPEARHISNTLHSAFYPAAIYPDGELPDWDRGYVIHHENEVNYSPDAPMVFMYDATGVRIREGRIWPTGAASVRIRRTAATREGGILATGYMTMQDGSTHHYIAKTDLGGHTVQAIETGSFGAERLCEAGDGSVWTLGREVKDGEVQREFPVLRQYSFEKGLQHSYLPQTTVEAVVPPRSSRPWFDAFDTHIGCGKEKVSVYLSFTDEYVEVDTSSFELKRWKLDMTALPKEKAEGLAVTEDGRVYASFGPSWMGGNIRGLHQIKAEPGNQVAQLLPVAGTITSRKEGMQPPPGTIFLLWGADGNQLVLWRADEPDESPVSWVNVLCN